jgi:hypothetical protein
MKRTSSEIYTNQNIVTNNNSAIVSGIRNMTNSKKVGVMTGSLGG